MMAPLLAKRIIAMGRTGKRDRQRQMNDALVRVANCEMISRKIGQLQANGNRIDLDQT